MTDLIIPLLAAMGGAVFAGVRIAPGRALGAALGSGSLAWGLIEIVERAPLSLGPEATWMGLIGAAAGALVGGSRALIWPQILCALMFLALWAGMGALGVPLLVLCAWFHHHDARIAQGPERLGLVAMLVLQAVLLSSPLAAQAGSPAAIGSWSVVLVAAWWALTGLRFPPHFGLQTVMVGVIVFSLAAGVWVMSFGQALAAVLAALWLLEALHRPALPGWWFLVLPGMLWVGMDLTSTHSEMVLPLGLVAWCVRLLRTPFNGEPDGAGAQRLRANPGS